MIHKTRTWQVYASSSLADLLNSDHDYVSCQGFVTPAGTYWLSDAFPGGVQEFGVVRSINGHLRQVESITTQWCDREKMSAYIAEADAGTWDHLAFGDPIDPSQLETSHQACKLCK